MSRFHRKLIAIATLVLGVSTLVPPAGAQTRTVAVALSGGQNTMFAPFLVAAGAGLFEKRGIKIDQQSFASGTASFAAFAGGSMPLCICGATQTMTAAASSRDVVSIFNQYHGGAVIFTAPKKFEKDRGSDLAKYDGATWAYTAEGSVSQVFMMRAAQSSKLKWENQKRIAIGGVDAFLPTLRAGRADLISMDAMSAARAMSLNLGYPVFNTNDPAQAEPALGRQLGLPMVTTRAWLNANPQLAQDIVDAMREALVMIQERANDPEAVLKLMPADYQANNKADFVLQWNLAKAAFLGTDGTFSDKAINDTAALARATGVLPSDPKQFDASKPFENKLAQAALAKFPSKR